MLIRPLCCVGLTHSGDRFTYLQAFRTVLSLGFTQRPNTKFVCLFVCSLFNGTLALFKLSVPMNGCNKTDVTGLQQFQIDQLLTFFKSFSTCLTCFISTLLGTNILNIAGVLVSNKQTSKQTNLMHGHLLRGEAPPRCLACQVELTYEHILLNCVSLTNVRDDSSTLCLNCFMKWWW